MSDRWDKELGRAQDALDLEQMARDLGQVAQVAASYYGALKTNGIPDALAQELVLGWQQGLFLVMLSGSTGGIDDVI